MIRKLKNFLLSMFLVSLFFSFSTNVFAKEMREGFTEVDGLTEVKVIPLTFEERSYLVTESGFTEEEVDGLHPDVGRELIEQEGKVVGSGKIEGMMDRPVGEMYPLGTIPDNDVTVLYNVVSTTSDLSGYKKYYALARFDWKKQPVNYYTDKMSIGFPSHMGVYFKTASSGKIDLHHHQYYIYNSSTNTRTYYTQKTAPADWDPALGVTGTYDLQASGSLVIDRFHGGTLGQYFYVKNTKVGEWFNIKFQYGHARTAINVGVTYPISGISLSPGLTVDTINKAFSLEVK